MSKQNVKRADIWSLLEDYAKENSTTNAPVKKVSDADAKKKKKEIKRFILTADVIGYSVYLYAFIKLALFDIDRLLLSVVSPNLTWLVNYKILLLVVIGSVIGLFFWRFKMLLLAGYLALFPFIVVFWKIPRAAYKARQWLGVMALVNAVGAFVKNLRYNLISKGIGIVSAVIILFSDYALLLIPAALTLAVILITSSVRTVKVAISTDWFLSTHEKLIRKVVDSKLVGNLTKVNEDIAEGRVSKLDAGLHSALTNSISFALILNRGLYFWAYQLNQYRQTSINLFFNVLTFVWLLAGGVIIFWLVNLAIFKIDPSQFSVVIDYSNFGMLIYSMSTLFFSEGAGITPAGNLSFATRLFAGFFGAVFLLTVLANILMTFRQSKNNAALEEVVAGLKDIAKKEDEAFENTYATSPEEGLLRMQQMGQGLHAFINVLASNVPKEFIDLDKKRE